jgi:glycosyltransferase involved in cell wall biosynthesis
VIGGNRRVSVLVPVFDAERYLGEALDSALSQSRPPAEVVVVDDGSLDGSLRVAASFGDRVRVIRQAHAGIGPARNRLVAEAVGEWLAFLDADDRWTPSALAAHFEVLETRPDADAAVGRVVQFVSPELPEAARALLACPEGSMPGTHPGASLLRRSAFLRVGPFRVDLRVGEFVDWWMRGVEAGLDAVPHDTVVLERRLHETNTGRREKAAVTDYLKVVRQALARRRGGAP